MKFSPQSIKKPKIDSRTQKKTEYIIGVTGYLLASIVFKFSMHGYEGPDRFMGIVYIVPAIAPGIVLGLTAAILKRKETIATFFAMAILGLPIVQFGIMLLTPFFFLAIIVMLAMVPTNLLAITVGLCVFAFFKATVFLVNKFTKQ